MSECAGAMDLPGGLTLTRRVGERVLIGDGICVKLLSINGNQARLNIVAPKHVAVDRPEIRKAKETDGPKHFMNEKLRQRAVDLMSTEQCDDKEFDFLTNVTLIKDGALVSAPRYKWLTQIEQRIERKNAKRNRYRA